MKFIILIVVIFVIYIIIKNKNAQKVKENEDGMSMLECNKCKTYVPANELVKYEDRYICKDCYDTIRS